MDANSSSEKRKRINRSKIMRAKEFVFDLLDSVDDRMNDDLHIKIDESKKNEKEDATDYMSCSARIYEGGENAVASGEYDSNSSIHAEMNALAEYIRQESDFITISRIEISSPPCKSCAFVLELLGVSDKVYTNGKIYKHATSAWAWPEQLKLLQTFDAKKWSRITNQFSGSGLDPEDMLKLVVQVVQNQSSN